MQRLTDIFFLPVKNDNTDIHPQKICQKCYSTLTNRATTSNITIKEWTPHSDNCLTCASVEKNKKGGRPTKKRRPGRPNSSNTYIWTREKINKFMSHVPADIFTDSFDITKLQKNNSRVKICLCKLCKRNYQTTSVACHVLFLPLKVRKNETDVKCPSLQP